MHIFFHPNRSLYDLVGVVGRLKGHKLLWSMEDPYESDLTFDMLPYFYYIFTSDQNTAEALKKEAKANHIQYVPHACNPKVHKSVEVGWEYKSDILFVGNAYESRLKYFQENMHKWKGSLFRLVGVGYRGLDGLGEHHVIHGHISEPEMVKYINGAKLVLNLHRQNSDLDMANKRKLEPSSFNNRYYEVGACKKPQIVVGRGKETSVLDLGDPENYSYKARLIKYYLPLLK